MTNNEMHDIWVATNKEHGATCRECKHSEFDEDGRFWGCRSPDHVSFPRDCPAVKRKQQELEESP